MGGWKAMLDTRKLIVSLFVIGALVSGTTSALAGGGGLTMTVTPTTVMYDEEFAVSGTGCFTEEGSGGSVAVGIIDAAAEFPTAAPDGTWSTTLSIPSESSVPAGTLTVQALCIPTGLFYPDVEITLVGVEPPTASTEAPSSSTTEVTAAVAATTTPRFTG